MSVTRSSYLINIGGVNVTSAFSPILISLSVTDKVGTHSDTASITVDDIGGRIRLPRTGDPVLIFITGTQVFKGTVDEVKASGSRSSGRTVTVTAKGLDTTKKAKEPQQRHFDEDTIQGMLDKAAKEADVKTVEIKGSLGKIKRKYAEMRDESFLAFGERLAREVGGNFKITGDTATMTPRSSGGEGSVTATFGVNIHSYSISPKLGRPRFKATKARWYDKAKAEWRDTVKTTKITDATATIVHRFVLSDEDETSQRTDSDKASTERDAGEGTVTIELNTAAKPDGSCVVVVGKVGVDGTYKIDSVKHSIGRGGGGTTTLALKQPET